MIQRRIGQVRIGVADFISTTPFRYRSTAGFCDLARGSFVEAEAIRFADKGDKGYQAAGPVVRVRRSAGG